MAAAIQDPDDVSGLIDPGLIHTDVLQPCQEGRRHVPFVPGHGRYPHELPSERGEVMFDFIDKTNHAHAASPFCHIRLMPRQHTSVIGRLECLINAVPYNETINSTTNKPCLDSDQRIHGAAGRRNVRPSFRKGLEGHEMLQRGRAVVYRSYHRGVMKAGGLPPPIFNATNHVSIA